MKQIDIKKITKKKARKGSVRHMHQAKSSKNDEFYTILSDVEKEMWHYKKHFKGKTIFCNCDDPRISNFFHYFSYKFEELGLKKLITTCYKNRQMDLFTTKKSKKSIWLEYTGDKNNNRIPDPDEIGIHNLKGDGDFRSDECIEILKKSDIIVTNPPFSLFQEYVEQLLKYKKKFLIIGNWNAIGYNGIFKALKEDKIWVGINSNRNFSGFIVPKHYKLHGTEARIDKNGNRVVSSNNNCWFTNLNHKNRNKEMILVKTYQKTNYPKYDTYDAINIDWVNDIPKNYNGLMGVPITFINKYNPTQFEIIGKMTTTKIDEFNFGYPYINGDKIYARLLIKHRNTPLKIKNRGKI